MVVSVVGGACVASHETTDEQALIEDRHDSIPNEKLFKNPGGFSAAASTEGFVDLDNAFFTPQGTNGRHCGTCHLVEDGWSIAPATAVQMFEESDGLHPLFVNNKDTDTPSCDMSTRESRWNCTTMLRQGKFTRSINMPSTTTREFDMIAVSDPFAISTLNRMWFFRRVLPTHTFKTAVTNWDNSNGLNNNVRDGLQNQARGNISGAQDGPTYPIGHPILQEIADYQLSLGHAQLVMPGVGRLDDDGAMGGPINAVNQPLVAGRFDLFDAWQTSDNPRRRQIYRGQEIFNTGDHNGRQCRGCHNASNHGGNTNNLMFDIGSSRVEFARPDMAVFTFQRRTTDGSVEIVQTTDPGRAGRSGRWADMNRFDTPTLRGLAARAPYLHNGTVDTIAGVVQFYEASLGFDFTAEQEADLVAFLTAL